MRGYLDRTLRTNLTLPFTVSAGDRTRDFTKDLEMAAILYLAESDRNKHESHVLKKRDEKLVFIAEACYPMWLMPWHGRTLLFDGLGTTAHTITYETTPDSRAFKRDIRNARTTKAYVAALSRNSNYFKNHRSKQQKKTIEGLIASPELIQAFSVYLPEINQTQKPTRTKTALSPIIKRPQVSDSTKELKELRARINNDIKNLATTMKLLSKTTRKRTKIIRREIRNLRKKSNTRIGKVRPRIAKKVRRIQKKFDLRITRINRYYKRQLQLLNKNQIRNRKMQRHLRAEIKHCQSKIESCKRRKNERGKYHWNQKLKTIGKKLSLIQKITTNLNKQIVNAENAKNKKISQQKLNYDTRIEQANKTLRELEAVRDATIKLRQQEVKPVQEMTATITTQMNEIIKAKRVALNEIDKIAIPRRRKTKALIYLPFYYARYEKENKKRYTVYPPSIIGNMGILTKVKSALGAHKIKTLMQPRSGTLTVFLNQLPTLIQKNPPFERELANAGIQGSILRKKKLRLSVKRGLKQLRQENWISENELQTLSKLLYIYA